MEMGSNDWIYLTISTPFKWVKLVKIVDFSTNQNATKLEFSIESSVLIYCFYL